MGFMLMTKEFNLYYWLAQVPGKAVMARYFEGVLTSITISKLEERKAPPRKRKVNYIQSSAEVAVTVQRCTLVFGDRYFTTMKFDIIKGMDIMEAHIHCMTTIITCWVYNPWNEFVQDNAPILLRIGKLQVYGVPHKWVFL